jgi:ribose 5-phosphate isomerase B
MTKIYIASDHAGFEFKEAISAMLRERGLEVEDCGPIILDPNDDYPDYVFPMAAKVALNKDFYGIAIGASGQGEAMVANRVPGVRAAVYYGPAPHAQVDAKGAALDILASSRAHNDANVLALGARFLTLEQAKDAVISWLGVAFSGEERHQRRIQKIDHTQ